MHRFYLTTPDIVQQEMQKFAELTGRTYNLVDYVGSPDAEKVIILMGSGSDTVHETVDAMNARGEKVGLLKVRLYRPFPAEALLAALPATARKIAVLDRTKEPGSLGEPLYLDVRGAISEAMHGATLPIIVGGRYALGSKEFTPAMVKAVFDNLDQDTPKNHFVVGIEDDVCGTSLPVDNAYCNDETGIYSAMFYGLASDGTVGANKNSIKIIGDLTDNNVQAYFVYDSKKAGTITTSHLRFGKNTLRSPYLINNADFIACHNFTFLEKCDMLSKAKPGATFLLNSPFDTNAVWGQMPREVQQQIIDKKLRLFVINAVDIAEKIGLGGRINVIMQTAFFKITGILPMDNALAAIKDAIRQTYGKAGETVVDMNCRAADASLDNIAEITIPAQADSCLSKPPLVAPGAPAFVQNVVATIIAGQGDSLPVSSMPVDGTFPTATSRYEKRNIALEIPVWEEHLCVQCGLCSFVCPHATLRMKIYDPAYLAQAPPAFRSAEARGGEFDGKKFTLQVAPEDCVGCGICVEVCPAKDRQDPSRKALSMQFRIPLRDQEATNWDFFLALPETDLGTVKRDTLKGSQLLKPLFEFSGACSGCGETPYLKLMSQLFGDRALIANATGCTSIYGGNLPTTPWATRDDGRGPAWSNSLFEDTAEFGFGMRLAVDKFTEAAREMLVQLIDCNCSGCPADKDLLQAILHADQSSQAGIEEQRSRVAQLKKLLANCTDSSSKRLATLADYLVKKSVWCVGGDGWAYDIGYGGLDHVIATDKNVNLLVLDTEVYSNTGGQASKSTPMGAVAQFAAGGKNMPKKDLGLMAMSYGTAYVATVSLANPAQTIKAFMEAEAFNGPSLIIAYSHCIAHGIDMTKGIQSQKKAVDCGHWPLYRYNPDRATEGKNPLQLDSKAPSISFEEFAATQNRFRTLQKVNPGAAKQLIEGANAWTLRRRALYEKLAD